MVNFPNHYKIINTHNVDVYENTRKPVSDYLNSYSSSI